MTKKSILFISICGIVLAGIIGVTSFFLLKKPSVSYQYISPEQKDLSTIVKANGSVKTAQDVDLSFERSGRISQAPVNIGDHVHKGDTLLVLDNAAEAAQVSQAKALLEQRVAGASQTQLDIYRTAADAAKADLDKTKSDTNAAIQTAQTALDAAENNLHMASGGDQSEIVTHAYQSAIPALQSTASMLDASAILADGITGIDHAFANSGLDSMAGALDTTKKNAADSAYYALRDANVKTHALIDVAVSQQSSDAIDAALTSAKDALTKADTLLSAVFDELNATPAGTVVTSQFLTSTETAIQTQQGLVHGQSGAIVAATQGIDNAKNGLNGYSIADDKAKQDLENAKVSAAAAVSIKQSVYAQAEANLNNAAAPARETDLAPLQAALQSASVAYDKTILRSPIDGVVTRQDGKVGAIISPNIPVVSVIDQGGYQLDVLVSETDISSIAVGNTADVTLDAYGPNEVFQATVTKVDPAAVQNNGANAYTVTLQFTKQDDRLKVGMTANAAITTKSVQHVLAVPGSDVIERDGKDFVLLKHDAKDPTEQPVTIGVKGFDGWWEVASGIGAQDQIVTF